MLALASLLVSSAQSATAASDMYHPYQSYDDYYKTHSVEPPPTPAAPLPPTQAVPEAKPLPAEQPITVREAPDFLFPPGLGFGVAIGVPYDMFYLPKTFYVAKGGKWYRSSWYKGPWIPVPITKVPPELRKTPLTKIHELRNKEFARYWKNRKGYEGKVFRPSDHLQPAPEKEKTPEMTPEKAPKK